MTKRPTYEELEQRVRELEKEAVKHRRSEKILRETARHLKTLFYFAPDPIVVCNRSRVIIALI